MSYGFRVAQAGKNLKNAADHEIYIDSAWPSLKTQEVHHFKETLVVEPPSPRMKIYDHNLGFVPIIVFYFVEEDGTFVLTRTSTPFDDNSIYYDPPPVEETTELDVELGFVIIPIDIEKPFDSQFRGSGASSASNPRFGVKIAKEDKQITSLDLSDYSFNSNARSLGVHKVMQGSSNPATAGDPETWAEFPHGLPYPPVFLAYTDVFDDGTYFDATMTAGTRTDEDNIYSYGEKISVIVLKDPFEIDDNIVDVTI